MIPEFQPWPKITRLSKTSVVITEKIDGTNACVIVGDQDGEPVVFAQSRKRLITPENDNFGFARWVKEHETELADGLGEGYHFGEWWGPGIGRGYDQTEKRFSLFDANRWGEDNTPACCGVVPVLYRCSPFDMGMNAEFAKTRLIMEGSLAAPGFKRPEGIVVTHDRRNFKVLLENDDLHKGQVAA